MSDEAALWVIQKSQHRGLELFCFYLLAREMNSRGEGSFASVSHLAKLMRMDRRSVQRFLRRIERSTELRCLTRGNGRVNTVWQIPGVVSDGYFTPRGGDTRSPQGRHTVASAATGGHPRGDPQSPNQVLVRNTTRLDSKAKVPPPPQAGVMVFPPALREAFEKHWTYLERLGSPFIYLDNLALGRLWKNCIEAEPECTVEQVFEAAAWKAQDTKGATNPVGVIISQTPAILLANKHVGAGKK
jgi:hypothetical protein